MSKVRPIRPLSGHTASGCPESLSKPLCPKPPSILLCPRVPPEFCWRSCKRQLGGEDEEECPRAASLVRFPVLLCALLPGLQAAPPSWSMSTPCPGCSEIRSLWLESPLPRPERARGGRGVSRERDEGVGVACRRWARKQAGASWPALKIWSVSSDYLFSAPSADGSFCEGGPGHLF